MLLAHDEGNLLVPFTQPLTIVLYSAAYSIQLLAASSEVVTLTVFMTQQYLLRAHQKEGSRVFEDSKQ